MQKGLSVILTSKEVDSALERIKEINKSHVLFDLHAHPFDVLGGCFSYSPNSKHAGLYSVNGARYQPPVAGELTGSRQGDGENIRVTPDLMARMALLTGRRLYAHTGSRLFSDHLRTGGLNKMLLLPVAGPEDSGDAQMEKLLLMFGNDDRFLLGYSIPNSVANRDIYSQVQRAVQAYQVRAIKIHANITGINLSTRPGRERVEYMLAAAGQANLPVVIHGGMSVGLQNSEAATFGILQNLAMVDWSRSSQAVIIAHAGAYGQNLTSINAEVLPMLSKMLRRHSNLYVDISGLEMEAMTAVIRHIDISRMVFGSDALYHPPWSALVKLLHVLDENVSHPEEYLCSMAALTPVAIFSAPRPQPNQHELRKSPIHEIRKRSYPPVGSPSNNKEQEMSHEN